MTRKRWFDFTFSLPALVAVAALLAACPSQAPAPAEVPAISGQVAFPGEPAPYAAQASLSDVANAATVTLIDATSNLTKGSTITDASGGFTLRFGTTFKPEASASYYLEAVRGLGNNAAGKDAARVRTIMRYLSGWQSITSAITGNPTHINLGTTAIAAIVSLKGPSRVDVDDVIGKLTVGPEAFTPLPGITASEFTTVKGITSALLLADFDPMAGIVYEPGPPESFLMRSNSSALTLDQATASIGEPITLRGISFDPALPLSTSNVVLFNHTATGSVIGLSADRQAITVTVPADAVSGPVTVRTGGKIYGIPDFTVWSTLNVDLF